MTYTFYYYLNGTEHNECFTDINKAIFYFNLLMQLHLPFKVLTAKKRGYRYG